MYMTDPIRYSLLDRLLIQAQHALATSLGPAPAAKHVYPAAEQPVTELDDAARRHAAGLMRINHAGEVCAQALYLGQAAVSRNAEVRAHLLAAAEEEADHLAWCAQRLDELGAAPSRLNPLWYVGSFAIGAGAALIGDAISLGFVVETERQVEAHLGDHLERLPPDDARSRAIVQVMREDEARHGAQARDAGARLLPAPIPAVMAATAQAMKFIAYRM
jgi:ubiquinone biosynthesis monooxygenase Coq7